MSGADAWQKRFQRERDARLSAESILEGKSRELYELNEKLLANKADLENQVELRTRALQSAVARLQMEVGKRRKIERDLRAARDSALEVADLKSQFVARMSHEMRTPLNAVIGLTGLLLDSELNPQQSEQLQVVRSSGLMLLRIINDILDLSRIDSNKLEFEYMPVRLEKLIEQTLALVMLDAERKGIVFELDMLTLDCDEIVVDGGRVQQVLLNLLSNAVKYSDGGCVTVKAELQPHVARDGAVPEGLDKAIATANAGLQVLTLSVADEGIGISEQDLERLFLPFSQFAGVMSEGTGLGLTICKRLCELMGGHVEVQSRPGQGSTFTVHVLCGLAAHSDSARYERRDGPQTLRSTADTGAWLLSGHMDKKSIDRRAAMADDMPLTILLADDYKVNRMVQGAQLEQLGYRVDAVANGEEVLRAMFARAYDVVLMDIRMPVMDGLEATRRLRQRSDGPQPFIVAVTASAMQEDKARYVEAGMDAYLSKPVELENLAAVLEQAWHCKMRAAGERPGSDSTVDFGGLYDRLGEAAEGLLRKVIPVYLEDLPERERRLRETLDNGDALGLAEVCHGLKGASRSIGAGALAEVCEQLEQTAFDGVLPDVSQVESAIALARRTAVALSQKLRQIEQVVAFSETS